MLRLAARETIFTQTPPVSEVPIAAHEAIDAFKQCRDDVL